MRAHQCARRQREPSQLLQQRAGVAAAAGRAVRRAAALAVAQQRLQQHPELRVVLVHLDKHLRGGGARRHVNKHHGVEPASYYDFWQLYAYTV